MFTGLIEACVPARRLLPRGSGVRLVVASPGPDWALARGASIAVSGACLSLVARADPRTGEPVPDDDPRGDLVFDLSAETLARTWFGAIEPGRRVNLERALRLDARLDGHLVSGHVDGRGAVVAVEDTGDGGRRLEIEVAAELARFLVDKGSLTVDGVSLTVVEPRGARCSFAIVPITLEKTSLGAARAGDPVHVEADLLGKWIDRLLAARAGA